MRSMVEQVKAARRVGTPIVAVQTVDPASTIKEIVGDMNGKASESAIVFWDMVETAIPGNTKGKNLISEWCRDENGNAMPPKMVLGSPAEFLSKVRGTQNLFVFMHQVPLYIRNEAVIQAIWNVRDDFKGLKSMLVLLGAKFDIPSELAHDVTLIDEPLPTREELKKIVDTTYANARKSLPSIPLPDVKTTERILDCVSGLSDFAAEQALAQSMTKTGIDVDSLWETKRQKIEQTKGLSVWRGGETFDDIGGCDNVKKFAKRVINGKTPPNVVVFLDEIEKSLAGATGSASDSSGTSQDQLGAILREMQDTDASGVIFVGPAGAAKSAIAKALGNTAGVPTIQFDLGAMKGQYVGQSEGAIRNSLKVVQAIGSGQIFWVATCNKIATLPPELKRRFSKGTFFFDLPSREEKDVIWGIYLKKFNIEKQVLPNDDEWTGAEIRNCCKNAYEMEISLVESSRYIVPVAKADPVGLKTLREQASSKYISASHEGMYVYDDTKPVNVQAGGVKARKIDVE